MKLIGLTGPTGSGKGLVSEVFEQSGIPVIDADMVYRELTRRRTACTDALAGAFSEMVLLPDGGIDRKYLSGLVFGDDEFHRENRRKLNETVHCHILAEIKRICCGLSSRGHGIVLVDAPQLFESGLDRECDIIVGVLADRALRIKRIVARDGITPTMATARIDSQLPDDYFRARCDYLLVNNGDRRELAEATGAIIKEIKEKSR